MSDEVKLELKEVQSVAFDMLCYLDEICKENSIRYCLMYGTALGAVRHRGFIPWDDDVDVGVINDDLDRLICLVNQDESPYRVLSCFDETAYAHPYAKMVDTRTKLYEPANLVVDEMGVFIDLFPLFFLSGAGMRNRIKVDHFNLMQKLYCYRFVRSGAKRRKGDVARSLASAAAHMLFPKNMASHYLERITGSLSKTCFASGTYICSPYDFSSIFPADWFLPFSAAEFCGKKFPVPRDTHSYLRSVYGESYMTPIRTEHAFHGLAFMRGQDEQRG